jgi:phage baseplate assembly protein W|tara:strand:+ start:66 stop:446 length:381 start_codon:yes stop_codon:yes gene_type:complete
MARFVDIDLDFTRNPITGDVSIKTDGQAVLRSIKNIVNTMFGEKKFDPTFGGNIRQLLFEPIGPTTTLKMEDAIKRSIITFEPRAILETVRVLSDSNNNEYFVGITFRIKNDPRPITSTITIKRVR